MRVGNARVRLAAWVTLAAMPLVAVGLGRASWDLWRSWPALWDVDDAMGLAGAAVGTAVAGYLSLTGAAMVLGATIRRGRAIPAALRALAPPSWQRVASVALGIGLTSGLAGPAIANVQAPPGLGWADSPGITQTADADTSTVHHAGLGWAAPVPAQTVAETIESAPAATVTAGAETAEAARTGSRAGASAAAGGVEQSERPAHAYVVQPGDSLWLITSALLGDGATDAQIAQHWPHVYELNRSAIGDNPSFITPGTELLIPAGLSS